MTAEEAFKLQMAGRSYGAEETADAWGWFKSGWDASRINPTETVAIKAQGERLPYAVSSDVYWRYDAPPLNAKLFLLNPGGVAILGPWIKGTGLLGWHPMLKRDESQEGELP